MCREGQPNYTCSYVYIIRVIILILSLLHQLILLAMCMFCYMYYVVSQVNSMSYCKYMYICIYMYTHCMYMRHVDLSTTARTISEKKPQIKVPNVQVNAPLMYMCIHCACTFVVV